jgi:lipoprotein-anchoring transpeptidase ErfK/SrfK
MRRVFSSFAHLHLAARLGISLLLVLFAAIALAPAAGPQKQIKSDVRIAGLNVAGLDVGQARQRVRAAFRQPVKFRFGKLRWQVAPERLGAEPLVEDAVSRALDADEGENVEVRVAVDKQQVRRYVAALERRFGVEMANAGLIGLDAAGAPSISEERWGRTVRSATMTAAITRSLRNRIRGRLPVVMRSIRPSVTKAGFGPVITINRGSNQLVLFNGSSVVRRFGVATGTAQYPTPAGTFSIADMQKNPWWRPPDSEWAKDAKPIPPGPGNPLGTRWMGLNVGAVGIHGTPDAASIGYSASHGCIRMRIANAEWLFERVRVGTPVFIVGS